MPEQKPPGRLFWAAMLAAVCAAAVVRLAAIHVKSFLWFDEFLSANLARHSWATLLPAMSHEAHPPLYFVLLKLWSVPFGEGRVAMKALSFVAGMGALLFLADAVRRLFGRWPALLAAMLLAFSTVQIDQSTDAKPYAVLAYFLALLLWAGVRWESEGKERFLWLAFLSAFCCASTHFFGGLAAMAVALAALLTFHSSARPRVGIVLLVSVATFLFWLPPALRLPRGAADYIREIWAHVPAWAPLAVSTRISLPGWRKPYPPMSGNPLPGVSAREWVGAVVIGLLFLVAFAARRQIRGEASSSRGRAFLVVSALFLFPGFLLAETVAGMVDRPFGLPGRLEVVTQIGLVLLCGAAFVRWRRFSGVGVLLLAAIGLWTALPQWWPHFGTLHAMAREEWIVRSFQSEIPPGRHCVIVTLGLARPPFDYFANGDPRIQIISFPESAESHPGWHTDEVSAPERLRLVREANGLAGQLRQDLSAGVPVFIAEREDVRNPLLLSPLEKELQMSPTRFAPWFFRLGSAREVPYSVPRHSDHAQAISVTGQ